MRMITAMKTVTYDLEAILSENPEWTEEDAMSVIEDWAMEDLGRGYWLIDDATGEEI